MVILSVLIFVLPVTAVCAMLWWKEKQKRTELEKILPESREKQITAETRLQMAEVRIGEQEARLQEAENQKQQAVDAKFEAEKQLGLLQVRLQEVMHRMQDWEKTKEESVRMAKEAMFETGNEIFKKTAEDSVKKTSEALEKIIQSVASLNDRVARSETTVETVWKSLSSPTAAGSFSEVGLENTLKNYGLEPGRDFVMQYAIGGGEGSLRPDAVVFLPQNDVLVIDSKASRFFLELSQAQDGVNEKEVRERLYKTMNDHLKALSSKGYKEAVGDYIRYAGRDTDVGHIFTMMFIHTESGIERLLQSDPEFRTKASAKDIVVSGPTGLSGLLSLTRFVLARVQQSENQEAIIAELSNLLGSIEVVLGYAIKVGKGIESAASNFQQFSASVNRNLLPKARRITQLGVSLPKNKELPKNVPSYQVTAESAPLLEQVAEE